MLGSFSNYFGLGTTMVLALLGFLIGSNAQQDYYGRFQGAGQYGDQYPGNQYDARYQEGSNPNPGFGPQNYGARYQPQPYGESFYGSYGQFRQPQYFQDVNNDPYANSRPSDLLLANQ